MGVLRTEFRVAVVLALVGADAPAQHKEGGAASSQTYFMAATEFGSGGEAGTALYSLQGSQGSGVVAEPHAAAFTYGLRGAFFGAATAPVLGQPQLTAARPFFVTRINNGQLTLHGTELDLGNAPTIAIGGELATTVSRTADEMVVTVPNQSVPGFQPVLFSNSAGSTLLAEGVGVLPMIQRREPFNGVDRNYLRIDTRPNDVVLLVLADSAGPGLQTLDFGYLLLLDPGTVFFSDAFFVADPEGRTFIDLPPFPPGLIFVQALDITADPDDFPGTWTNMVAL
ncbi:MAG: hypothetical protein AB8H80_07885 [Planctomycetota bacterium]